MLREGEVFVYGLDRPTAQALLAAAREVGADRYSVRAIDGGFIVPEPVADRYVRDQQPIWTDKEAVF